MCGVVVGLEVALAYNTRNLATKDELGKVSAELDKVSVKLDMLIGLASGISAHVQQLDRVQDKLLANALPPKQR